MKKTWVTIGIVIIALALILVVISLVSKDVYKSSEESLYKYSYTYTNTGCKLTIKGKFPEGTSWTAFADGNSVDCKIKKQNSKKAVIEMQSVNEGSSRVFLSLEKNASIVPDRQYEIIIESEVNNSLKLALKTFSHIVPLGLQQGMLPEFSYEIGELADGTIKAAIHSQNPNLWNVKDASAGLAVNKTVDEEKNLVCFDLKQNVFSQDTLYLVSSNCDISIQLSLFKDAIDRLRIASCTPADYVNENYVRVEDDYFKLIGRTKLPEGATALSSTTTYWVSKADNVTGYYVGVLNFSYNDKTWTMYVSDTANVMDFSADLLVINPKPETVKSGNLKAQVFKDLSPMAAVWESANGYRYLLLGDDAIDDAEAFSDTVIDVMTTVK